MLSPLDALPTLTKTGRVRRTRKGATVKTPTPKKADTPDVQIDCPPDMLGHIIGSTLERSGLPGIHERLENDDACWNNIKKVQVKYKDKIFGKWMLEIVTFGQILTHSAAVYREKGKEANELPEPVQEKPSQPLIVSKEMRIQPDTGPLRFTPNPQPLKK